MKRELFKFAAKASFVYILVVLAVLVSSIVFYAFVVKPANDDNNTSRTYYVQGTASRKVTPDTAIVVIGTTTDGTNLIELQNKVNTKINAAIKDIKALGIKDEDVQTYEYNVSPKYDTQGVKITGYTIKASIKVTIRNTNPEANAVSNVIAKGTAAGLNDVSNFTFSIEDQEKIQEELKLEAIDNAKAKAKEQAKKAGIKLGKITNMQESSYYPYYNYDKAAVTTDSVTGAGANTAAAENTISRVTIQPGQYELTSYITLYYEIK